MISKFVAAFDVLFIDAGLSSLATAKALGRINAEAVTNLAKSAIKNHSKCQGTSDVFKRGVTVLNTSLKHLTENRGLYSAIFAAALIYNKALKSNETAIKSAEAIDRRLDSSDKKLDSVVKKLEFTESRVASLEQTIDALHAHIKKLEAEKITLSARNEVLETPYMTQIYNALFTGTSASSLSKAPPLSPEKLQ
jgi:exonuclease VII small subunit